MDGDIHVESGMKTTCRILDICIMRRELGVLRIGGGICSQQIMAVRAMRMAMKIPRNK